MCGHEGLLCDVGDLGSDSLLYTENGPCPWAISAALLIHLLHNCFPQVRILYIGRQKPPPLLLLSRCLLFPWLNWTTLFITTIVFNQLIIWHHILVWFSLCSSYLNLLDFLICKFIIHNKFGKCLALFLQVFFFFSVHLSSFSDFTCTGLPWRFN